MARVTRAGASASLGRVPSRPLAPGRHLPTSPPRYVRAFVCGSFPHAEATPYKGMLRTNSLAVLS